MGKPITRTRNLEVSALAHMIALEEMGGTEAQYKEQLTLTREERTRLLDHKRDIASKWALNDPDAVAKQLMRKSDFFKRLWKRTSDVRREQAVEWARKVASNAEAGQQGYVFYQKATEYRMKELEAEFPELGTAAKSAARTGFENFYKQMWKDEHNAV